MSLFFNNTEINTVIYNNIDLDKLVYNNIIVFEKNKLLDYTTLKIKALSGSYNNRQIRLNKLNSDETKVYKNGEVILTSTTPGFQYINIGTVTTDEMTIEIHGGDWVGDNTILNGEGATYNGLLSYLNIGTNLKKISPLMFYGCSQLKGTINIPATITEIGSQSFRNCSNISKIVINAPITKIQNSTFYNCENLKEIILPDSLLNIESMSFYGCKNLKTINFPNNITSIGNNAFEKCTSLEEVILNNGILTLNYQVFKDCTKLKKLVIPSSVESIGNILCWRNSSDINTLTIYCHTLNSSNKVTSTLNGWTRDCYNSIIHLPSSLNDTSAYAAFGDYFDYINNNNRSIKIYDL